MARGRSLGERAKAGWHILASLSTWQRGEYRASMDSLNLFFGAIIGVAFSGIEDMPLYDYGVLLFLTAVLVAAILTVSNTRRRLWALFNLGGGLLAYWVLGIRGEAFGPLPETVFPTLLVWAAMAVLFEFTPREKDHEQATER